MAISEENRRRVKSDIDQLLKLLGQSEGFDCVAEKGNLCKVTIVPRSSVMFHENIQDQLVVLGDQVLESLRNAGYIASELAHHQKVMLPQVSFTIVATP